MSAEAQAGAATVLTHIATKASVLAVAKRAAASTDWVVPEDSVERGRGASRVHRLVDAQLTQGDQEMRAMERRVRLGPMVQVDSKQRPLDGSAQATGGARLVVMAWLRVSGAVVVGGGQRQGFMSTGRAI